VFADRNSSHHRRVRDIDLRTLRLFVAACDCRSMARAAERERIEPSAISKRIAQLEDSLGVELLQRGRRGVQATPAGIALLEHARSVVFTLDRMLGDADAFARGAIKDRVRVLACASAIAAALPDDIALFMREPAHAQIRVDLDERVARELVRAVREGAAPLGVCWDGVDFEGLAQRRYRGDRLVLAVYAGHPFAGRTAIDFEQTLEVEHVGLPAGGDVHTMLQRAAARAGRAVAYRGVVSTFDAALRVVAADLGVAVVPLAIGRRGAGADVELIPIRDAWAERRFAICCRDFAALPAAGLRLVEYLEGRAADAPASG
jgi:DNA-binding transcriptional LysR family regulator